MQVRSPMHPTRSTARTRRVGQRVPDPQSRDVPDPRPKASIKQRGGCQRRTAHPRPLLDRDLPPTGWLTGRLRRHSTPSTFTFMSEVRKRRRGATRISSKHQITIPADALRAAGLEIGDRVVAHADGAGRVLLEREHDILAEFAGTMTGAYTVNELDDLRREWD